jgi:hypothetical protein
MPSLSSSLLEDVSFSPNEDSMITSALPLAPPRISAEYDPLVARK